MEALPKDSLSGQGSFEIQEIKEAPAKIGSPVGGDQDVAERRVSRLDSLASSAGALTDRDEMHEGERAVRTEQEGASDRGRTSGVSRRVIELGDSDSKMVLRRQLGEMAGCENSNSSPTGDTVDYENMEILQKLPPDTIVIRQKARSDVEDSDCREPNETNSTSGSSTSGGADVKPKGISRALRNKTWAIFKEKRNVHLRQKLAIFAK